MKYTYLFLNIITILFPLFWVKDKRIRFHKKWKALAFSIGITAIVFLVWDIYFTKLNVWSFNDKYISGINIINLPLEEWLFFFTIPFSCLFIHEVLKYYFPKFRYQLFNKYFPYIMIVMSLFLAIINHSQIYTFTTLCLLSLYLVISKFLLRFNNFSRYALSYLFSLPAFYLINGLLTSFPVVNYNDLENFGIRIGTIPLDDHFYLMLLLLMNISLYEFYLARNAKNALN